MKTVLLAFILLIGNIGLTQDLTSAIKGTVVDKQSQFELPGVKITLTSVEPNKKVGTDDLGQFRLENVPVGRHDITVEYIGYEKVTLSNLVVTTGKELHLNISLEESVEALKTVVVKSQDDKREALNEMSSVSARTFSVEEANRYSGSFQDPARMAQNFAGVSGASDDRNDIIIRGNSPTGVLWRLEGIDIPSPNHFSTIGTTGGPVSMLNINNLSNSDFMTSAFSADYGNALAGVFDLKLRNGNADDREYLGQVGFNGFEFGAEGPFKKGKRASYLANYRYSTLGVLGALGLDVGTGAAIPQYQDLTFKINMPTKKAGRFTLFGIGGTSYIEFKASDADSTNLFSEANENSEFRTTTGVLGFSHTYFFNPSTYSKLVVSSSVALTEGSIDSVSNIDESLHRQFGFDRQHARYSFNYKINKKFSAKNTVSVGVMGEYNDINFLDSVRTSSGFRTRSNFKGGAQLIQGYALWQHRFTDKLTMNSGLHSQHFLYNNSNAIEPRLGFKYKANPRHTFSTGYGLHSQIQPITVYFVEEEIAGEQVMANKNLDFTKSAHGVIGHDFLITADMRLKTEVYYQHIYGAPVDTASSSFSMLNEGADFGVTSRTGLTNGGTGSNYGIELTLEKFFTEGYYFLTTVSIFDSKYKGSDDIERNTVFNGNYVVNALGGKEFKLGKKNKATLSLDTKLTYAGGRRYTPIDLEASQLVGAEIRDFSRTNSDQYPAYFKWDFKISYTRNGKKTSQKWSIDLQNVLNIDNIFQYGYNATTGTIDETYQRGFFPDVQYKIFF